MLSELSTNAFIHGQRPVTCQIKVSADELTIAICQPATGTFDASVTRDTRAVGGRGLQLVNAIATQWGQQFMSGKLTVWATLPNPPAGQADLSLEGVQ